MTVQEFSNEFDILYNNIMSNKAPGLDSYEKSVLLTQALESIVTELYNGKNVLGDSFEKTEELRRSLDTLITTKEYTHLLNTTLNRGISNNSTVFKLEPDLLYITYEEAEINGIKAIVVPTTLDEYYRIMNNPFKGPSNSRVLRLDCGSKEVELISKSPITKYIIRYIKKPKPIILEDLDQGLTIDEYNLLSPCELSSVLHRAILVRAVLIASSIYKSN